MAKDDQPLPSDYEDPNDQLGFYSYIEGLGRKDLDPLSPEALEIQAKYVRELPQHPMDIIRRIMVNPFCSPNERISAAKTLMEYSMRKVPSAVDVSAKVNGPIQIDAAQLEALSAEDLDALQSILSKTGK